MIKAVLQDARAMVVRGWCQGHSRRGVGVEMRRCAHAAIADASGARDFHERFVAARDTFVSANGLAVASMAWAEPISAWNDQPERTLAEVLDAFDRAIEQAPE